MELNKEQLKNLALDIVGWIEKNYLLENGLVSSGFLNGRKVNKNLLSDLGDYLPFLYIFGAHSFCLSQIEAIEKIIKNDLLPPTQTKFGLGLATSYAHTDFLLGLMDYYKFSGQEKARVLVENFFPAVIKFFSLNKIPHSFYLPQFNCSLPVLDTRDGTYVELMLEWYEITGDKKYLDLAFGLFNSLKNTPFFKKHKLFPKFIYCGFGGSLINKLKKFNEVSLMKHNTNTLFAFLELYKVTGEASVKNAIYGCLETISKDLIKDGLVLNNFSGDAPLTANFSVIDFLCDSGNVFGDAKLIGMAKEIANFWLLKQSETTGLFPQKADSKADDLDCCTDMMVALMKLHELAGEEQYKTAAEKCFSGVIAYHKKEGGYCLSVNIDTGEVVDAQFKTKFITLFLKAIYLFMEGKIYNNDFLFNLLKDR